jgi:hypothetical protein
MKNSHHSLADLRAIIADMRNDDDFIDKATTVLLALIQAQNDPSD